MLKLIKYAEYVLRDSCFMKLTASHTVDVNKLLSHFSSLLNALFLVPLIFFGWYFELILIICTFVTNMNKGLQIMTSLNL